MTLPRQTITVLDPGLGLVQVAADTPVLTGTCAGGSLAANTLASLSSIIAVKQQLGVGELAERAAKNLAERGGPILVVKSTGSVAGSTSAVAKVGTGTPTPTVAGTATMRTKTLVRVRKGGALGVAQFDYSHDNWQTSVQATFSTVRVIPSGGTYAFPKLGITMTFPAGTYVLGDTYEFTTEPARSNSADVAAMAAVVSASQSSFRTWTMAETYLTATEGFAIATALGSVLQALSTGFRYTRGIVDVGSGDTTSNVATAKASFQDKRISPFYGYELTASQLAFEGYGNVYASAVHSASARANRLVASSDMARYAEGSLGGVQYISHDSFQDTTLDDVGISTLRTWPRVPGFYIGNGYLAAGPGSDFIFWPFGRLMDLGCDAVYQAMLPFMADDLRTIEGGTLDPLDGAAMNSAGLSAMQNALTRPRNARGRPGLVSSVDFVTDLTNNVAQSGQFFTTASMRPRGYVRDLQQTIGFTTQ